MWGRWQLESQRQEFGYTLFVNEQSRYTRYPRRCVFDIDGRRRAVTLDWQPLGIRSLIDKIAVVTRATSPTIDARILPDGTRWYAMPPFNGDPGSLAGKALPPMIAGMMADRAALAVAPAIVLDLRGNGGGTSD